MVAAVVAAAAAAAAASSLYKQCRAQESKKEFYTT